jgi:hypothetical protein
VDGFEGEEGSEEKSPGTGGEGVDGGGLVAVPMDETGALAWRLSGGMGRPSGRWTEIRLGGCAEGERNGNGEVSKLGSRD